MTAIAFTIFVKAITIKGPIQKRINDLKMRQKRSKEQKNNNFCYRKVERPITKWGAIIYIFASDLVWQTQLMIIKG